jgi:hypothetical protein
VSFRDILIISIFINHSILSVAYGFLLFAAELVINFDQTGLNVTPTSEWTMEQRGAPDIEIICKEDKRQITCVLACSLTGELLPPQLVYGGKTNRCHPDFSFPDGWDIAHSPNHWSNAETMIQDVDNIIAPYCNSIRGNDGIASDQWALCILDVFKAHQKDTVLQLFEQHRVKVVFVPPNCTGVLQPLVISGNGTFKDALKSEFITWYANHIRASIAANDDDEETLVSVNTRLSTLKPLHAGWVVKAWEVLKANRHVILTGWAKAGIRDLFNN